MKLSQTRADKLSKPGRYHDGFGLYLQVTKQGSRSWVFRYERAGCERWMGLGPCRLFTLRDARTRANACQQKLWDGIDPITVAHEERAAQARESASLKTFREASNLFYDQHHTKWTSATYRGSFHQRLNKYVHPKLGSLPVARISKPLIIETLTPIWNEKNSTAIKCLGLIENVLDFAKVSGWRDGENPAVWKGNLQYAFPSLRNHEHHEALPFAEISEFMKKLREVKTIAARALEFTILTAVRRDEARLATWDEINFETKRWTIPAARMKMKKDHVVPLSPAAIALLKALPREHSPWIFIGTKIGQPIGHDAPLATLKQIDPEITVHGFRSTFRDWAAEKTNYPNHICEMALAHVVKGAEKAYRRGNLFEQRIPLMNDWSRWIETTQNASADILPMRAKR
jgi:integrase